jgi:TonB family protein
MKRPRSSFAIPASISLALHAVLLTVLPRYFAHPWDSAVANKLSQDAPALPDSEPVRQPERLAELEIGDTTGNGFAAHDAPAPNEATAREAELDQASLALEPPGAGEGEGGVTQSTKRVLSPFGVQASLPTPRRVRRPEILGGDETPQPVESPGQLAQAALLPTPAPTPSQQSVPQPGGSKAARMSDSESDPFSRIGSAVYVDGAWRVRFGRKVKTRKPKLLLAAQEALFTLQRTEVVFNLEIDESGKVKAVKIVKSSGSNDLDQPTRLSMFDWWFEPKLNADGNPVPDQFQFTIGWR